MTRLEIVAQLMSSGNLEIEPAFDLAEEILAEEHRRQMADINKAYVGETNSKNPLALNSQPDTNTEVPPQQTKKETL